MAEDWQTAQRNMFLPEGLIAQSHREFLLHKLTLWHLETRSEKQFFQEDRRCLQKWWKHFLIKEPLGNPFYLIDWELAHSWPCAIWTLQPESCWILLICSPPRPMTLVQRDLDFSFQIRYVTIRDSRCNACVCTYWDQPCCQVCGTLPSLWRAERWKDREWVEERLSTTTPRQCER